MTITLEQVKELLTEVYGKQEELEGTTSMGELKLRPDKLLIHLKERFEVDLSPKELEGLDTVDDLIQRCNENVA